MSLRQLLTYAHENPDVRDLIDASSNGTAPGGERAFVSASLRPYLLAAPLDAQPQPPPPLLAARGSPRPPAAAARPRHRGRRPRRARPRRRPQAVPQPEAGALLPGPR